MKRVRELERRCKGEPCQRQLIVGMLYANVLSPVKIKHVMSKSYPKGRVELWFMKVAIEELETLEEKARPQKMHVSPLAVADVFSHEEWVSWMEWRGDEQYEEQNENPSLDAIGGKATGTGKSKKGKGKGKPKDKGKYRPA